MPRENFGAGIAWARLPRFWGYPAGVGPCAERSRGALATVAAIPQCIEFLAKTRGPWPIPAIFCLFRCSMLEVGSGEGAAGPESGSLEAYGCLV